MKKALLFFTVLVSIWSCSKNDATEVNIRVFNASSYDFENIMVGDKAYGDLVSGQKSEYQKFDLAYRYAFVELEIDGETYTLQPIDFVGETPLEAGFYSYRLDANDSEEQYGRLSIGLIED